MRRFSLKRWLINILLGIDQLANAILMGDPDETISSRMGKTKRRHGGKIPFCRYPLRYVVDSLLEAVDKNHSVDAIEDDEGNRKA